MSEPLIPTPGIVRQIITATALMKARPDLLQFQTLREDSMTKSDLQEVVDYLISLGAKWEDDRHSYEGKCAPNTFHLWLVSPTVPRLTLYCGFQYDGLATKNYAFEQYAKDAEKKAKQQ